VFATTPVLAQRLKSEVDATARLPESWHGVERLPIGLL